MNLHLGLYKTKIQAIHFYKLMLWIINYLSSQECVLSRQLDSELPGDRAKRLPDFCLLFLWVSMLKVQLLSLYWHLWRVWWFILSVLTGRGRYEITWYHRGALILHTVKCCLMNMVLLSQKEQDLELGDPGSNSGSPRNYLIDHLQTPSLVNWRY